MDMRSLSSPLQNCLFQLQSFWVIINMGNVKQFYEWTARSCLWKYRTNGTITSHNTFLTLRGTKPASSAISPQRQWRKSWLNQPSVDQKRVREMLPSANPLPRLTFLISAIHWVNTVTFRAGVGFPGWGLVEQFLFFFDWDWMFPFTFSWGPSDVSRRSEHCSNLMRRLRRWMRLLSTRTRPSLRGRDSWGRLPACSPSGRWTSWPNSVTCQPLRPERCCASTSTRSVNNSRLGHFKPCSHSLHLWEKNVRSFTAQLANTVCTLKAADVNGSCRWCLCVRRSVSFSLPWLSWKCSLTISSGWCSGWRTPWIARSSTLIVGSRSSRRNTRGAYSSCCSSVEVWKSVFFFVFF